MIKNITTTSFYLMCILSLDAWNSARHNRWHKSMYYRLGNSFTEHHEFAVFSPLTFVPKYEIGGNLVITKDTVELTKGDFKETSFGFMISEAKFSPRNRIKLVMSLTTTKRYTWLPKGTYFSIMLSTNTGLNSIFNSLIAQKTNLEKGTIELSPYLNGYDIFKRTFGDLYVNKADHVMKINFVYNGSDWDISLLTTKQNEKKDNVYRTYNGPSIDQWSMKDVEIEIDPEKDIIKIAPVYGSYSNLTQPITSDESMKAIFKEGTEKVQLTMVAFQPFSNTNMGNEEYSHTSDFSTPFKIDPKLELKNFSLLTYSKPISEKLDKNKAGGMAPLVDRIHKERHGLFYGFKLFLMVCYHMLLIAVYLTFIVYLSKYKNYCSKKTLDQIDADKIRSKKNVVLKSDLLWHGSVSFIVYFFGGFNVAAKLNLLVLIVKGGLLYKKNYFRTAENEKDAKSTENAVMFTLIAYGIQCGIEIYLLIKGITTLI